MGIISVDFNDSIFYKEVNYDFLLDFFEFIYKYISFYVSSENTTQETLISILCLCIPEPSTGLSAIATSLEQTRVRLGDKIKEKKKEAEVYTAFDRIKDDLSYKNVIDAIKIYYFSFLFENVCANYDISSLNSIYGELERSFQNNISSSPNFTYQKETIEEVYQSDDPNENMLNLSYEDILKNVEKFLEKNSPKTIYDYLNTYIVGQDKAKMQISIGVYYYLKKLVNPDMVDTNNNMLMVGPSGCGKTEIVRVLQKFLPIPVIIYDIASLTCAGYKGDSKDNILRPLAGTNGIALVFLDEFDKICTPNITASGTNFSYETQGQILSMIEGNTIPIDDGEAYINTRNTLFIAGGAFENMEIASKKKNSKETIIGFATNNIEENEDEDIHNYKVAITDVIKYGLRTELAGRFSSIITLYPLTEEELHGVIMKYISYYEKMLNKKISFKKNELNTEIKTNVLGCRHIKQIIYEILTPALFEAPIHPDKKTVKISKNKTNDMFDIIFI